MAGRGHPRGGSYDAHRDFLTVHWEVRESSPRDIRLHVEAPRESIDPDLNSIKADIIAAFLDPSVERAIAQRGLAYRVGRRISDKSISRYKSTEPFRIELDASAGTDMERNLMLVHHALADLVGSRLAPFLPEIERHFG